MELVQTKQKATFTFKGVTEHQAMSRHCKNSTELFVHDTKLQAF